MDKIRKSSWFEVWFNSPYYHILYNNRNDIEAQQFIDNLLKQLNPEKDSFMLDVACGKGRHAKYLATNGYDVTGIDLAERSIREANKFQHEKLHFYVHDMRQVFRTNYYHYVFNFFTSFGYFENELDNVKTMQSLYQALKPNGLLVLDFLNVEKVLGCIPFETTIDRDGIVFHIKKKLDNGFIVKDIVVKDGEKQFHYTEYLQALTLQHFENYFAKAGFTIKKTWGNYELHSFHKTESERLILVCEKL